MADEAKKAWEEVKEDLNNFKLDMRTNFPQPGPEAVEKESRANLRNWGVRYINEYKVKSRGLDKKLFKMRAGIEEDRREPRQHSGRGGEPSREQRSYRPDRALMPDKGIATLKYSMGLEEVERILTRHLPPGWSPGWVITASTPHSRPSQGSC